VEILERDTNRPEKPGKSCGSPHIRELAGCHGYAGVAMFQAKKRDMLTQSVSMAPKTYTHSLQSG
jgi:hypothetical protein